MSASDPEIATEVEYTIVSSDTAVSTKAAQTMNDPAKVQNSLQSYVDGPVEVQIACSNCDDIIELNTATPMIVYVILFGVLLAVLWGVGLFVYGRQTGAATMIAKVETVVGAVANPMFDAAEGVVDVSTSVVTETVDATAGTAVKKTAKTAKKTTKKGAKKAAAIANPMYDGRDDED